MHSLFAVAPPGVGLSFISRPFSSDTSPLAPKTPETNTDATKSTEPDTIWSAPNLLSIGRGVSGPFIAYLIIQESWPLAFGCLAVSGATDWLDGYLARRLNLHSVLGSYLDPIGDKVLIGSVVIALACKGIVPIWVAAVIAGRDIAFVLGLTIHRLHMLKWRPSSAAQFFQVSQGGAGAGDKHMPIMQPIMISKVNTVLQLALLSGCLSKAWLGWPDSDVLTVLEYSTAATTVLSTVIYAKKYASGKLV
eukprot:gene23713-9256_t